MTQVDLCEMAIDEIRHIPESHIKEVYDFLHFFRVGIEASNNANKKSVMDFAGAWADMDEQVYHNFEKDVCKRRLKAFSKRKDR